MSDKERLDEIKQRHSALSSLEFGGQSVKNQDIAWLIQRAEQAERLEKEITWFYGQLNQIGYDIEKSKHEAKEKYGHIVDSQ